MVESEPIVRCGRCGADNQLPRDRAHGRARCGRCAAPLPAEAGRPLAVTEASFADEVLGAPGPVLVDFWAPWCGPCRALAPVLDDLAARYAGRLRVAKVNVDDHPILAARYGVQGIPALLLFVGGRLVDRLVGLRPRAAIECQLHAWLDTATERSAR